MNRIALHLAAIEAWLLALPHEGGTLVREVRRQLDLFDAEDVERVSFASPAAFLVLPRFRAIARPDGGRDALLDLVVAIAARGSAAKPMDAEVIDRALTLAAALDDQDFAQERCLPAIEVEARPVLQAGIETRGIAVVAVSFRQTLLRVTEPPEAVAAPLGSYGAGSPSTGTPGTFEGLLGTGLTSEEQAAMTQWGAPR